jgi:N-acetylglucosaminyl-diphospho-decaprenol L-rhamnosyltransferase
MPVREPTIDQVGEPEIPRGQIEPSVLIVIVNYCTSRLTIDCLRSLELEVAGKSGVRVVVADNASPDGSGREIAEAIEANGWSGWAQCALLDRNGGFAFGNNAAIRARKGAEPDYYWLLNSDTAVRPGAMRHLTDFLDRHPHVGIAGSRLEYLDGVQQISTFRFPTILGEIEANAPVGRLLRRLLAASVVAEPASPQLRACDWLAGASMMIRAKVIDEIGLMDEGYFLYYEETDFCLRARRRGWQCWFVPDSRVVHFIGASTGVTGKRPGPPMRRPRYWFASRRRYFVVNHGRLYAIAADVGLIAATVLRLAIDKLKRRSTEVPEKFLHDLVVSSALFNSPESGG